MAANSATSQISARPETIRHLNVILKNELTAINQYYLHAKMLKHQGYAKLADYEYQESIDEMKHADRLAERILFLGGLPNFQDLGRLNIGETPKEMLEADLAMELRAHNDLVAAHKACDTDSDAITQILIEDILKSEEEHIDWLRKQLDLIASLGIENYLQAQL